MTPEHRRVREQLGALALGQVPATEARALEAHLEGCEACRGDYAEIAPLAGLLAGVEANRLSDEPAPPGDLGDRMIARVATERRSRRRARFLRAGAVAAAAAAAAVILVVTLAPPSAPPQEPVAFSTQDPAVEADVNLVAHTWGTEFKLVGSGFDDGRTHVVTFRRGDGTTVAAGTFIGVGDKTVTCDLNAALLREDAVAVTVSTRGGRTVLQAEL